MFNINEINADLIRCGYTKMAHKNKWTLNENSFALPNTYAQYINHDSEYQYSSIRKMK